MMTKFDYKIEQNPGQWDYNEPAKEQIGVNIGQIYNGKRKEDLQAPWKYTTKSHIVEGPQF